MSVAMVRRLALVLLSVVPLRSALAQDRYAAVVEQILQAWKTADVVCLGEDHGRQFDSDLRIALVRHPDFSKTVRVIVVESANPVHQDLLDRFILDGVALSREEMAPVWRDASGADVWESPIYEQFLRAVREVNLALPREQRVRVLGGDSPINWPAITRAEQLVPLLNRGANIRNIIADELLEKNVKGLAIYGARHCDKIGMGFPGDLVGKYPPGRMWSIEPLVGRDGPKRGRKALGLDDAPAYLVVTGTSRASIPAGPLLAVRPDLTLGEVLDAVVYHGNVPDSVVRADQTELNNAYGAELQRRRQLMNEAFQLWQQRRP
jgi:hypothetical protein